MAIGFRKGLAAREARALAHGPWGFSVGLGDLGFGV